MRDVMLNLLDRRRAIHAKVHGSFGDTVVGALAAEPDTIEELAMAAVRFVNPVPADGCFAAWALGVCDEPWDAGIVIVDLAARLIVWQSSCSRPTRSGQVRYRDAGVATDVWLSYSLADDWLFSDDGSGWRNLAETRRRARAACPPLDARAVLYGRVTEFVATQCTGTVGPSVRAAAEIHARWLTTPRLDLRNQTPRDLLRDRRDFVDRQLEHQQQYWSRLGHCPPGLDRRSAAYRFGGFGTHETVMYYDLVRYLAEECWERVGGASRDVDVAAEIDYLEQLKQEWLHTPRNDLQGHSPAQVIDRERARLPLVSTPGDAGGYDCDCPLCQMMMASDAPVFWWVDGSHMDNDFAFTSHDTLEVWEVEQGELEDRDQEWKGHRESTRAMMDETGQRSSS